MDPVSRPMEIAVAVSLALFVVGVVYQAGRLAARVESLEAWRIEMKRDLDAIHTELRNIVSLIKGEGV
jgi:hypothetical protein